MRASCNRSAASTSCVSRAAVSRLRFCPTGGVMAEKAVGHLALGNGVCVGGAWMLPKAALAAGDDATVERQAREAAGVRG